MITVWIYWFRLQGKIIPLKLRKSCKNTRRSARAYWSLLKMFLNNKNAYYLATVPQKWVFKWFQEKAEQFNYFFVDQYFLINHNAELPSKTKYLTKSCLSLITFSTGNIANMIHNLDPTKGHGHDQISIRMIKFCNTLFRPQMTVNNVVSVCKKGNKQILGNYR